MSPDSGHPLRILHCIHSLSGGGAETQLRILTSVSHNHGMTSAIFCVNAEQHQTRTDHVRIFRSATADKYNFSVFPSLSRAIDEFHPQILHAWLPASLTIPGMLIAALKRVPCVFSYRSAMHFHRPLTVPEFICAALLSSQVVSNNPIGNSQRLYQWLYRRKAGVHISNAVDVDPQFLKSVPRSASVEPMPFTILYAGRLVPEKNWRCLIRAVAILRPTLNLHLRICGEGPDRGEVDGLIAELQLGSQVQVLGFRSDLHGLMQQSDAFVLPSWFEGMPNVLLEALAIGLPAIVSDIPSHRQIVGTTGSAMFFNPASADQLAKALDTLATSETRQSTMVHAGRTLAAARRPSEMAEQYRTMYQRLLARHAPGEATMARRMNQTRSE